MKDSSSEYKYLVQGLLDSTTIKFALDSVDTESISEDTEANAAYQYLIDNSSNFLTSAEYEEKYDLIEPYVSNKRNNRGTWSSKFLFGEEEYTEIQSFSLVDSCMSSFGFGNIISKYISFNLPKADVSKVLNVSIVPSIVLEDTGDEFILGKFKVYESPSVDVDTASVTAYDAIYDLKKSYYTTLEYSEVNPVPLEDVLNEAVELSGKKLVNPGIEIPKIYLSSALTCDNLTDAFKAICGMIGCNLIANADGNLQLIWVENTGVSKDSFNHIYNLQMSDQPFNYGELMCTTSTQELISGNTGDILRISASYMNQESLDSILARTKVSYYSCNGSFIGDPAIESGDIITMLDESGYGKQTIIMSNSLEYDGAPKNTISSIIEDSTVTQIEGNENASDVVKNLVSRISQWCYKNNKTLIDGSHIYCGSLDAISANLGTITAGTLQSENYRDNEDDIFDDSGNYNPDYKAFDGIYFDLVEMILKTPCSTLGKNFFKEDGEITNGTRDWGEEIGDRTFSNGTNNIVRGVNSAAFGENNSVGKDSSYTSYFHNAAMSPSLVSYSSDTNSFSIQVGDDISYSHYPLITIIPKVSLKAYVKGNSTNTRKEYPDFEQVPFLYSLSGDISSDKKTDCIYMKYWNKIDFLMDENIITIEKADTFYPNYRELMTAVYLDRLDMNIDVHFDIMRADSRELFEQGSCSSYVYRNACIVRVDAAIESYDVEIINKTGYNSKNIFASGIGLIAQNNNQSVFGKYNDNKSNTLIEVGNGNNDSDRFNVFELYSDNTCYLGYDDEKEVKACSSSFFIDDYKIIQNAGIVQVIVQASKSSGNFSKYDKVFSIPFKNRFNAVPVVIQNASSANTRYSSAMYSVTSGNNTIFAMSPGTNLTDCNVVYFNFTFINQKQSE